MDFKICSCNHCSPASGKVGSWGKGDLSAGSALIDGAQFHRVWAW